jgi:hypothetical protein
VLSNESQPVGAYTPPSRLVHFLALFPRLPPLPFPYKSVKESHYPGLDRAGALWKPGCGACGPKIAQAVW